MPFKELREEAYEANMELNRRGLVLYTFGNASAFDADRGIVAIKPSGVSYEELSPSNIVLVDLENNVVEGDARPSSDTKTHTYLYKNYPTLGGVVHTHSTYATAWAQARRSIPCMGTTHADYVNGDIPCTEPPNREQVDRDYELETGVQIVKALEGKDPKEFPMILVGGHAPFTWGKDAAQAVYHAVILEELAKMAQLTHSIQLSLQVLEPHILNKHYQRKHGPKAYYGQD